MEELPKAQVIENTKRNVDMREAGIFLSTFVTSQNEILAQRNQEVETHQTTTSILSNSLLSQGSLECNNNDTAASAGVTERHASDIVTVREEILTRLQGIMNAIRQGQSDQGNEKEQSISIIDYSDRSRQRIDKIVNNAHNTSKSPKRKRSAKKIKSEDGETPKQRAKREKSEKKSVRKAEKERKKATRKAEKKEKKRKRLSIESAAGAEHVKKIKSEPFASPLKSVKKVRIKSE